MKLRIVSGILKGRMITIPDRDQDFRPTRERIRQAVASILTHDLTDAVVADVCAGSGAMGFEMLSRGAEKVVFVENDRHRCQCIRTHAEKFGIAGQCMVQEQDVASFTRTATANGQFDIIYYDPPYDSEQLYQQVPLLAAMLAPRGVLLYERRTGSSASKTSLHNGGIAVERLEIRSYGETEICIVRSDR